MTMKVGSRHTLTRRLAAACLTVMLGLPPIMSLAPSQADAAYVLFMRSFGEWSVICSRDEPTERQTCVLGAPPPDMALSATGVRARLEISADGDGRPTVRLFIHHVVDTNRHVSLRIDGHAPHVTEATRGGEAAWQGNTAVDIVGQMTAGRGLAIGFFETGVAAERQRIFSLVGFTDALAVFREAEKRLRTKGSRNAQAGAP